jgi:hypothetical protein
LTVLATELTNPSRRRTKRRLSQQRRQNSWLEILFDAAQIHLKTIEFVLAIEGGYKQHCIDRARMDVVSMVNREPFLSINKS